MATFKDLGLNPMIQQALDELGFTEPTPIQAQTIPHLLNTKQDLIALAQTGTGKTAAFSLPVVNQITEATDQVQTLILCPTRELAMQVAKDIQTFAKYMPGCTATAVYGGERVDIQIRALKKKPQIVVGTPGRVHDLIRRRVLKVDNIKWLILDEADEMLNMGFKEELDAILENTAADKQVLLFSATMNKEVRRIAQNYMQKPDEITVGERNKGSDNVQHFYYIVHEKDRYAALRRIADVNPDVHAIIFCRTRRETQQVADKLIQDHYAAEAIHGEVSQEQRILAMKRFKEKKIQLLVATDVAARGIDVKGLTHVINYNLPESDEAYVHRSGRTGRANNLGISLVIVNMREQHKIRHLERKIGKPFEKGIIPNGQDICEKQLFSLIEKVRNTEVDHEHIDKYIEVIKKKFENMDRETIINKFISVEFNRFLDLYKNAPDLNTKAKLSAPTKADTMQFTLFKINIGRNIRLNVKELLSFINSQPGLKGVEIGTIQINDEHTTFEIDATRQDKVVACFKDAEIEGIQIKLTNEGSKQGTLRRKKRAPQNRRRTRRGGSRGRDRNR